MEYGVNKDMQWLQELFVVAVLLLLFLPHVTYSAEIDFNTIISAMKDNAEPLIRITGIVSYVIGIWFVISAIAKLKTVGQQGAYGSHTGMSGPIIKLVIGLVLMYLPTTINITVTSFWGGSEGILGYTADTADIFAPAKEGAIAIVRVIGYIAFVRGLIILSHSADSGAQPGSLGKGMMSIVGGILAINVVATMEVISHSLGFDIF